MHSVVGLLHIPDTHKLKVLFCAAVVTEVVKFSTLSILQLNSRHKIFSGIQDTLDFLRRLTRMHELPLTKTTAHAKLLHVQSIHLEQMDIITKNV